MLEVLTQDYIRTAWSKGLPSRVVIVRHALRNALIPLTTILGMSLAYMLAGSVLIENIFALPGMGQLTNRAIFSRDFPILQGILLFVSTVILLMNLLTDIGYAVIDPRVRYK
jgi:peptide/nickel transport system permease protein